MVNLPDSVSVEEHTAPTEDRYTSNVTVSNWDTMNEIYWWEIVSHKYDTVTTQVTAPDLELDREDITIRIASCRPKAE